jgi:multiple sugar transport system permease protein
MARPGTSRAATALLNSVLTLAALAFVAPLFWMVSTSLKSESEIFTLPLHWVPWKVSFEHYIKALTGTKLLRWFWNSVFIAAMETGFGIVVMSLAAYPFARMKFAGKNVVFVIVLSTMMIPSQVTFVPTYLLLTHLGWINTFRGIVIPNIANAFGVFLLRQFFEGIPRELEDAARIDGCGRLGIFLRVIVPLSGPALAALGIFRFLGSWNDFLWPMIVLQEASKMTLPVGLAISLQATYTTASYGILMAAAFVSSAPILLVYIVFQEQIIRGVTLTGVIKG